MRSPYKNPDRISDFINISGQTAATVSLSTSAAESSALSQGVYDVWCGSDCFIRVGSIATGVTTANGYPIRANTTIPVFVPEGEKIGGVLASGTATLSYHKIG